MLGIFSFYHKTQGRINYLINYSDALKDYMHRFFGHQQVDGIFSYDGAPPHRRRGVRDWLAETDMPAIKGPGNLTDLNPTEDARACTKSGRQDHNEHSAVTEGRHPGAMA